MTGSGCLRTQNKVLCEEKKKKKKQKKKKKKKKHFNIQCCSKQSSVSVLSNTVNITMIFFVQYIIVSI